MLTKEAKLLEGKVLAAKIQEDLRAAIQKSGAPSLLAIQAGQDPSADWYVGQQEKLAAQLGISFKRIPAGQIKNQSELISQIKDANSKYHGIFIAMPLPQGFNADEALLALNPKRDVEGIHPASLGLIVLRKAKLIPPTAFAALKLIESTGIELRGKRAVIIGQSAIVGRPLNLLLGERRVTTTICNTGTSQTDLGKIISESDIVVGCAGQPGLIKGKWIKDGAIVIDVGTTPVVGADRDRPLLVGDVEFDEARKRAAFITPVPGGVGPLTVTMLMQNLMTAYQWQKGLP